ncbi:MAG: MarR family transcriptional regulator [Umezawaea sp.]
MDHKAHTEAVEQAMIAIRRRQTRRALARQADLVADLATYDVLDAVEAAEQTDQQATVTTIATALAMDQPRASKLVAKAVAAGLVQRQADQRDGRRALLVRTELGRATSERIHEARRAAFDLAMADWSPRERAEFAGLLTRFVAALP